MLDNQQNNNRAEESNPPNITDSVQITDTGIITDNTTNDERSVSAKDNTVSNIDTPVKHSNYFKVFTVLVIVIVLVAIVSSVATRLLSKNHSDPVSDTVTVSATEEITTEESVPDTEAPSATEPNIVIQDEQLDVLTAEKATYKDYSGTIDSSNESDSYTFTPSITGTYCLEFFETQADLSFSLVVYDSLGTELLKRYTVSNGNPVNFYVENANTEHKFVIGEDSGSGKYNLRLWFKKAKVDISKAAMINDSIEFSGQVNNYSFVPARSGYYRFEFREVYADCSFELAIYDHLGEKKKERGAVGNEDGITIKLNANEEYKISVRQGEDTGPYEFHIGHQTETMELKVVPVTVTDSITFKDQSNYYEFSDELKSGTLTITSMNADTSLEIIAYDHLGAEVKHHYSATNGDSVDIEGAIRIEIAYSSGFGQYTFRIQ